MTNIKVDMLKTEHETEVFMILNSYENIHINYKNSKLFKIVELEEST